MRVSCLLIVSLLFAYVFVSNIAASQDTTFGIIWDQPVLLSDPVRDSFAPKITLSGDDTIHIIWESGGIALRLPYRRSVSGGDSFSGITELLTDSDSFPGHANWVQMATSGAKVFVFFQGSTATFTPLRMITSTNAGLVWGQPLDVSSDLVGEVRGAAIHGDSLAVVCSIGGMKRVLRSSNGGQTWTRTNNNVDYWARLTLTTGVLHLVQHTFGDPPEIEYRRSHDLGDTWDHVSILSSIDGSYSDIPTISSSEDSLIILAWRDSKYGCMGILGCSIISRMGVLNSDSVRWFPERTMTDVPRGSQSSVAISTKRSAITWADEIVPNTTFHAAVRVTSEGDTTWCPVADITPATQYEVIAPIIALSKSAVHVVWSQAVAPSPSTFRIFYQRGRFITTEVNEPPVEIPRTPMLAQNYPNPFNHNTKIVYRTAYRGPASLKVYDMLGREVATLVREILEAGERSIDWDATNISSGVYYYQLIAGDRVQTKKAILIR